MKINIHSHHADDSAQITLRSFFHTDSSDALAAVPYQSCGIHPWHILNLDIEKALSILDEYCRSTQIMAIGECGLDKFSGNLEQQILVFKQQVELSEKYALPMVIHSVKTHQYLVEIRRRAKASQPWIIHGYQSSLAMAKQLINHGMYLSFGHSLRNNEKSQEVFRQLPLNRIFFETDDKKSSNVEKIYAIAESLLNLPAVELEKQILNNFIQIFGTEWIG